MLGLDAKVVRNGSASCDVSPLSDAGIMSTTRTPGGGGGAGGEDSPPSGGFWGRRQAATAKATAARRVVARMALLGLSLWVDSYRSRHSPRMNRAVKIEGPRRVERAAHGPRRPVSNVGRGARRGERNIVSIDPRPRPRHRRMQRYRHV